MPPGARRIPLPVRRRPPAGQALKDALVVEEVADAVAWLATRASYVNGCVLHVNGGLFGG